MKGPGRLAFFFFSYFFFFQMCLNEFAGFLSRYTLWLDLYIYIYIYLCIHTLYLLPILVAAGGRVQNERWVKGGEAAGGREIGDHRHHHKGWEEGCWWEEEGGIVDDGGRQLPGQPFFILFIFSLFIPGAPVMRRVNVARRLRRLYLLMGEGLVSLRFSLAWQLRPGRL